MEKVRITHFNPPFITGATFCWLTTFGSKELLTSDISRVTCPNCELLLQGVMATFVFGAQEGLRHIPAYWK